MRRLQKFLFAHRNPPASGQALAAHTLEVVVQWGTQSVLHVAHSSPPRAFHLGDAGDAAEPAAGDGGAQDAPAIDFVLDRSLLGCERLPLALVDGDQVRVLLPAGAYAQLQLGDACIDDRELATQGKLRPAGGQPGARSFALPLGGCARVVLGELVFTLTLARSEHAPALADGRTLDWKGQRWTAASLGVHVSLLALFMFLPPTSGVLALNEVDTSSRLVAVMLEGREREPEPPVWKENGPEGGSEAGERAAGDEGAAGTPDAPKQPRRGAARGHAPRPALPAEAAPDPTTAGILGMLRSAQLTAPMAFTGERAQGNAVEDVMGGLTGALGPSFGRLGAGMIGTGKGGGGDARGSLGSGPLGTIGTGAGPGGEGGRYGKGVGGLGGRDPKVPLPVRLGKPDIHGSLSKETIRRVIHRHLAEIRDCYQQRLIARPDLQGRIAVRFMIAPTGVVQGSAVESSELRDPATEQCVVQAVRRWTFPQPQGGGIVRVSYPFLLQQMGN